MSSPCSSSPTRRARGDPFRSPPTARSLRPATREFLCRPRKNAGDSSSWSSLCLARPGAAGSPAEERRATGEFSSRARSNGPGSLRGPALSRSRLLGQLCALAPVGKGEGRHGTGKFPSRPPSHGEDRSCPEPSSPRWCSPRPRASARMPAFGSPSTEGFPRQESDGERCGGRLGTNGSWAPRRSDRGLGNSPVDLGGRPKIRHIRRPRTQRPRTETCCALGDTARILPYAPRKDADEREGTGRSEGLAPDWRPGSAANGAPGGTLPFRSAIRPIATSPFPASSGRPVGGK
jgi:hypothetical protein